MTRLRATFRFNIGELFVRRDELGSSHELATEPSVRLQLPSADDIDEWVSEDSPFTGSVRGPSDGPPELRGVRHLLTIVEFDADLSAADFPTGDHATWPIRRAYDLYDHANQLARDGYRRFRAWAHVSGDHHRLGMSHDEPDLAGVQSLEDLNAGQRIPVGYPPIGHVILTYDPEQRERVRSVAAIVRSMETGAPPVAATMLADASAIYSHEASAADHQRAVLLAAIASEMTVKERLRALASNDMAALVDVILSNPREVTQSPSQLLHKTCKAVTGISLSDEDKTLFKDVERLFHLRNSVAHRGRLPTEEQGIKAVDTATRLARWLANLPPKVDGDGAPA